LSGAGDQIALRKQSVADAQSQRFGDFPAHWPPAREHGGQVPAIYVEVRREFTTAPIGRPLAGGEGPAVGAIKRFDSSYKTRFAGTPPSTK
jgi:hypothetical protein